MLPSISVFLAKRHAWDLRCSSKSRTVKLKVLISVTALIFPRQHPSLLCLPLLREKATPFLLPLRRLLSFLMFCPPKAAAPDESAF